MNQWTDFNEWASVLNVLAPNNLHETIDIFDVVSFFLKKNFFSCIKNISLIFSCIFFRRNHYLFQIGKSRSLCFLYFICTFYYKLITVNFSEYIFCFYFLFSVFFISKRNVCRSQLVLFIHIPCFIYIMFLICTQAFFFLIVPVKRSVNVPFKNLERF